MPSPDLAQYDPELKLFDKDPQDVFEAALADLKSRFPEWVPREGHTEVVLMESLALEVAESVFAINRLPGAIVEVLLRLYGITRDVGDPPTTTLTFTLADTVGHTLPAGTRARLELEGGLEPVTFETTESLTISPGSSVGTVAAVGDRLTADANGTVAPALLELVDAVAYVDYVRTASVVADGRDPEDDETYLARGVARFARLSEALVLPTHFEQAALENNLAFRAKAVDNYDPGQAGAAGTHPGHVTVAVYGENDVPLSQGAKDELDLLFEERALVNLAVHVVDPTVTAVNVTLTARRLAGFTSATVQASIVAALREYLDPDTWPWAGVVRRNELIALVSNVEGVDFVETITSPAADVTLAGVAALVRAGTITVTVNAP